MQMTVFHASNGFINRLLYFSCECFILYIFVHVYYALIPHPPRDLHMIELISIDLFYLLIKIYI
jgi:hypothetical protein